MLTKNNFIFLLNWVQKDLFVNTLKLQDTMENSSAIT